MNEGAAIKKRKPADPKKLARRDRRKRLARKLGLSTWTQVIEAVESEILPNINRKVSPVDLGKIIKESTAPPSTNGHSEPQGEIISDAGRLASKRREEAGEPCDARR